MNTNFLSGTIPAALFSLEQLSFVDLAHNLFVGGLPCLASAPSLVTLNVSDNMLAGTLPDSASWYHVVEVLSIGGNAFSGRVPASLMWSERVENRTLLAGGNHLTGVVVARPRGVRSTSYFPLRALDLSYNTLGGDMLSAFCAGSPRDSLVLSFMGITGSIPHCIAAASLAHLDLSNNFLTGTVPVAVSHVTAMRFVSLAHNNLEGTLPSRFFDHALGATVDVSQNFLNGTMPIQDVAAFNMTFFDVTGNCGLQWPTLYRCGSMCSPTCCSLILCSDSVAVCNLIPQLPATRCAPARPPAPLAVSAASVGSDGALLVNWTSPPLVHARFCRITGYRVRAAPPAGGAVAYADVASTDFSAVLAGIPPGVIVSVSVAAVSCAGLGEWSFNTSAVAVSTPGAPTGVTAVGANAGAVLQWDAPNYSGLKIESYEIRATAVAGGASHTFTVAASGACHENRTLAELTFDALYTFQVRAVSPDVSGPWSPPSAPVLTFVVPSLVDQLLTSKDVLYAAGAAAAIYAALLLTNRRCPGRDTTALFRLAAAAFHIGTSALMGVKLVGTPGAVVQQVLFFVTLALAAVWSAARIAAFVQRSLLVVAVPPPHGISFDAWCTRYRAWLSALALVSVFDLAVLGVLRSRALGPLDGLFSAPVDPRLWAPLLFHATATALLRGLATLLIIVVTYPPEQYLLLSVAGALASAVAALGFSAVTLLVDAAVRAGDRRHQTSSLQLHLLDGSVAEVVPLGGGVAAGSRR